MSSAKLVWATPDGEKLLGYIARVSNPKAKPEDPYQRLIGYLFKNRHWSPFEMVNVCVEVTCSRDVSRQILRHRSLYFQEFSGRYAAYLQGLLGPREARLQDDKNRQNSLVSDDRDLNNWWYWAQTYVGSVAYWLYEEALKRGIAKEVARAILPEGYVPTKMYINGTVRSWIHYLQSRTDPATQKEHREVALAIQEIIYEQFPTVRELLNDNQ